MAAVRVEDDAFTDERYGVLATLCGLADADHARGKMLRLWRQCTALHAYVLPEEIVCSVLGENGAFALEKSALGERVEGGIRIKGTKGRIEWLRRLRKNAAKGGKAKASKRQALARNKASRTLAEPFPTTTATTTAKEGDPDSRAEPGGGSLGPLLDKLAASAPDHNARHAKPTDHARELADVAVREINRLARKNYQADAKSIRRLCRALSNAKYTAADVVAVVASKREWIGDPTMGKHFNPDTLLALRNFEKYVDAIEAQRKPIAQDSTAPAKPRPEAVHPLAAFMLEDVDAAS